MMRSVVRRQKTFITTVETVGRGSLKCLRLGVSPNLEQEGYYEIIIRFFIRAVVGNLHNINSNNF